MKNLLILLLKNIFKVIFKIEMFGFEYKLVVFIKFYLSFMYNLFGKKRFHLKVWFLFTKFDIVTFIILNKIVKCLNSFDY